jgi:hypothetical protein
MSWAHQVWDGSHAVGHWTADESAALTKLAGRELAAFSTTGSSTAVSTSVPLVCNPSALTEHRLAGHALLKEQASKFLGGRLGQVMPAVSCAALITYGTFYANEPLPADTNKHRDMWVLAGDVYANAFSIEPATFVHYTGTSEATTARPSVTEPDATVSQATALIADQPRYDYREAIAYAKRMGLPTEFPL